MSTCQGAAPPHNDCPHGDRCDWVAPFSQEMAKKVAEEEQMIRDRYPNNRQGRRALERALKKRAAR